MINHDCSSCGLTVPKCGRKRKVTEGWCNIWVDPQTVSSKEIGAN